MHTQHTHIYQPPGLPSLFRKRELGALIFCSATLWFRLIGWMYFYIKIFCTALKQMLRIGKGYKGTWRVSRFEVHWATLLIYTVNACVLWQPHYLFNSEHVLHIKQQSTDMWKCKLAVKLRICSLIQEYIALLCKRSHAYAEDYQTVTMLSNFLQQQHSVY